MYLPIIVSYQWMLSCWPLLNVFKRWIKAVRWQPAQGFATVQDSTTLQYQIIADGNIAAAKTNQSSTILTTLSAYDTSFQDLWPNRVMVHNNMLWTLPPPEDHFRPLSPASRPARTPAACPLPPFPYPERNPPPSSRKGSFKRLRAPFIASQGMLELAAPLPPGERLMTYIFSALPEHTGRQYPKMMDNDGKADCLICFRSAFWSPHNTCQLETCITARRRQRDNQRLHIDLPQEPWRSKPEIYWKPVVAWLQHPGVDLIVKPTAAFKSLTPSAKWS
jgi:hypothetical protein